METPTDRARIAAWFAGPKAENGEWFADTLRRIVQDYYSWRRNYFPEDGVVIDSTLRRQNEGFQDAFDDRLMELLARLKADFPFHSPRYAAHMLAEQTLPAIAGYFAAMLYNPNNVSKESAPVTVRLELEAAQLIARMLGYGAESWAHLTGGGTIANLEALWMARSVRYLPLVVRDMRAQLGLGPGVLPGDARALLSLSPTASLDSFARVFDDAAGKFGAGPETTQRAIHAYLESPHNVVERGLHSVSARVGAEPVVLVPQTHHYCFEKAMDALGLGRRSLINVGVDDHFRMRVDDLASRLDEASAQGRLVLGVVGVAGTTEEGAIDPIDDIVALRARREREGRGSFWIHADAAYGGYLRTLTVPTRLGLGAPACEVKVGGRVRSVPMTLPEPRTCNALEALSECDSITVDPHKLGYIPYPAGAICFRSNLVKPIARQDAPYINEAAGDVQTERHTDAIGVYILEGSKPGAAAAAVWLSHTLVPLNTSGHGVLMQDTIRAACELHTLLEQFSTLAGASDVRAVPLCAPGSNIVCYAFRRQGRSTLASLNALNERIYSRFTRVAGERVYDQQFFVSRTRLSPGQYSGQTVGGMLDRLGVSRDEFAREGVFLLRSVLMNPWYAQAKTRGRYFVSELVEELYRVASEEAAQA